MFRVGIHGIQVFGCASLSYAQFVCRLEEALTSASVNIGQQMRSMKTVLDSDAADSKEDVEQKEIILDSLLEIVDNIDYARGASLWCWPSTNSSCSYLQKSEPKTATVSSIAGHHDCLPLPLLLERCELAT